MRKPAWVVAVVALGLASATRAAEPPVDAHQAVKRLRDHGADACERGDYLGALDDFQKAYALYPSPNLRFNVARVLTELGRDVEALEAYEAFLAEGRDAPAAARAVAETKIAILTQRIGQLRVRPIPDGAAITIDGRPRQIASQRGVRLSPGLHQVAAEHPGYLPELKQVSVLPAQSLTVELTLRRLGADRPRRRWLWPVVASLLAAAGAGVALGVIYGRPQPAGSNWQLAPQTSAGFTRQ